MKNASQPTTHLSDAQRIDWLRLIRSDNVGPRTFRALVNHVGSARAALERLPEMARRGGASRPARICSEADAQREIDASAKLGVLLIAPGEAGYPPRLAAIEDAPPLLGVRGVIDAMNRPMIGIVGSRNASGAGLKFAGMIARELGDAGFVVVSGLARGIDQAAHRASLAAAASRPWLAATTASIHPNMRICWMRCCPRVVRSRRCRSAMSRAPATFPAATG